MELEQELAAFRAEFARTAPPGRAALYADKIEALRTRFAMDNVLQPGDNAPDFTLPDAHDRPVALADVLETGPAVLTFYRGGWCPYCNIQLRAYQRILPALTAQGARLLAISPQLPDGSLTTADRNALTFDVLSDVGNTLARRFGLVYALDEAIRAALISNGKALPGINGDDSWELPVPATFIIAPDRRITYSALDVDYRRRPEPGDILAALAAR